MLSYTPGRNLAKKSNIPVTNALYPTTAYQLYGKAIEVGEVVYLTLNAVLGEGKTEYRIFNSDANTPLFTNFSPRNKEGVYDNHKMPTYWKIPNNGILGSARLLFFPIYDNVKTESTITQIMFTIGDHDEWRLPPEEVQTTVNCTADDSISI